MHLSAAQWPRLGALFQQVFGHALEEGLADYKYAAGRGESLALLNDDGQIIAHCGMIFRSLLQAGLPAPGVQFGDLMVAPEVRGILSRQGLPFTKVFIGALERVNRAPVKPLVFGFPSDRATRLGARLGVIKKFDEVSELTWSKSNEALSAVTQPLADPRFRKVVDKLWGKMAQDLANAVVGVRDAEYFVRRYFQHPAHRYHVYLLRTQWLKRPTGVFVLRSHGASIELVDWVAPLDKGAAVIEQARRAVSELGGERLTTWLAGAYSPQFAVDTISCQSLEICVALGGEIPAAWLERFGDHMWITSGDTDYR